MSESRFGTLDLLLVLVTVAWGANFSVIKVALQDFPVHAFNALRLVVAGVAFAVILRRMPAAERRVLPADRRRVVVLGLLGGTFYQLLFVSGVPLTSVANAGLIFGLTPVVISLFSSAMGHEQLSWTRWAGGGLSVVGLYFVVGAGAAISAASLRGDVLIFVAMLCWSAYSVASRPLLGRYSPMMLTAWTSIGAVPLYLVAALPSLAATPWADVRLRSWLLMLWSSVFCLVIAYTVWYTGVQRLGATRTSAYSNLTPIAAMAIAWWWLGETVSAGQAFGALAILSGVFLTRLSTVVLKPV